eukprot:787492-Rhodomonas_salina.1
MSEKGKQRKRSWTGRGGKEGVGRADHRTMRWSKQGGRGSTRSDWIGIHPQSVPVTDYHCNSTVLVAPVLPCSRSVTTSSSTIQLQAGLQCVARVSPVSRLSRKVKENYDEVNLQLTRKTVSGGSEARRAWGPWSHADVWNPTLLTAGATYSYHDGAPPPAGRPPTRPPSSTSTVTSSLRLRRRCRGRRVPAGPA